MEKQFCALGEPAEQFLIGAAAIGNTRLNSELNTLLALGAAYSDTQLLQALTRAVAFKRFRAADVLHAGQRHAADTGEHEGTGTVDLGDLGLAQPVEQGLALGVVREELGVAEPRHPRAVAQLDPVVHLDQPRSLRVERDVERELTRSGVTEWSQVVSLLVK